MKHHLQFAEILANAGPQFIQRPQMGKLLTTLSFQGIRVGIGSGLAWDQLRINVKDQRACRAIHMLIFLEI